jgi:hypothetical protein
MLFYGAMASCQADPMRSRLIMIVLWAAGILFPAAWLGRFSPTYQRVFDAIFAPPWMHIAMHALLYAVLAALLVVGWRISFSTKNLLVLAGVLLLVGIGQESLQALLAGFLYFEGALFDLGIDLAGGLAGLTFAWGMQRIHGFLSRT